MKMTILSIEYSNIRKFKSLLVKFTNDNNVPFKNSFVMMGNGTGKTTTITLIKGLLDGSADSWNTSAVRSYAPVNADAQEGSFKITVRFDEKVYIYVLSLNYVTGKASTHCTTAAQGGLGPRKFPPALTDELFTQEFVRRFIFDGEQAVKAMDNTSNEAEDAIKYLYRLDVFDKILQTNRQILTAIQDSEGAKGTAQSVANLRSRQAKIGAAITRLQNRQRDLSVAISEKKSAQDELETQIARVDERYKGLNRQKIEATERRNGIKANINLCISQILDGAKSPYYVSPLLCSRMYAFGDSMTKLKLPKTISKDFFTELAHTPTCICGRSISECEKAAILANAERYLGSDQQSVLNNIKSCLMNSVYDDHLQQLFDRLGTLMADLQIAENNLLDIEDKLAKAGGEEAVKLRTDRDTLIAQIGKLNQELDTITSRDDNNPSLTEENNLPKAKAVFSELEAKIASATRTNEALRKKELVDKLVNEIKQQATDRLKQEIIEKTNAKLKKVITDDIIEIESIDKYIKLNGKTGASEGQTLSIAYCFLGTMFEDSELQFPFVIDSPAGKMDFVKRKAVANILPKLFNQMIAFVTSAEVEQFADQFYEEANTQFITIIANPNMDTIEMHPGKEYFDSYQRIHREEES